MEYFNEQNTEGYNSADLKKLNELLAANIAGNNLDAGHIAHIAETVLLDYDTDTSAVTYN